MFAPRTTPKDELTFHEKVTTVLRHMIEGPINGTENRPWAGTYGCKSLMATEPQGLFSDLIFGPKISLADGLVVH